MSLRRLEVQEDLVRHSRVGSRQREEDSQAAPALYGGGRLAAFLAMRGAHPGVPDQVLLDFQAAERQPALPPSSDGGKEAGPAGGQAPGQILHNIP